MNGCDETAYLEYAKCLEQFGTVTLFSLQPFANSIRRMIILSFISRALVTLRGVTALWGAQDYHDCRVLTRCLIERALWLRALDDDNSFDAFEEWSFVKQFEANHVALSDPAVNYRIPKEAFKPSVSDRQRYEKLRKRTLWKEPRPEAVAKAADLVVLYKHGYDRASSFVHPRANEGEADFLRLTGLGVAASGPENTMPLHNAAHATWVVLHYGMKFSGLGWRVFITDFMENLFAFLETGSDAYKAMWYRILNAGPMTLCGERPESGLVDEQEPAKT